MTCRVRIPSVKVRKTSVEVIRAPSVDVEVPKYDDKIQMKWV